MISEQRMRIGEPLMEIDEQRVGKRVARLLSESTAQLDSAVLERLRFDRQRAVALRSPGVLDLRAHLRSHVGAAWFPALRPVLTAAVVLALFLVGDYVKSERTLLAQREVETALLTDDLPIDAYLDQGFRSWLLEQSRS